MRALAIAFLFATACNQVIGVDKFTSIDASASVPDSAIDATLEFDAPTIDASMIDAASVIDARPDAMPPDAPASCGDNTTEPPEQCDTGAVDTSTCDSDCTFPMCGDGHTNTHYTNPANGKLEQCDGGGVDTSTCNKDCTTAVCGDGYVNGAAGEVCDTSGDTATCDSDCTPPSCGDGHLNTHFVVPGSGGKPEQCDKGASNSDTTGTTCTTHCQLPACGDGILEAGEGCDDNNKISGDGCSSTCAIENGYSCTGSPSVCNGVCGDGVVVGTEVCDDDNTSACGNCSFNCSISHPPAEAAGQMTFPGATQIVDGETITLDDGFNAPTVFELDPSQNGVQAGHVQVKFAPNASPMTVASTFITALNAITGQLLITGTAGGTGVVILSNDRSTALGNRAIMWTVSSPSFTASGMTGGAAADCPSGTGCNVPSDCASGTCTSHVCQ